AGGDRKNRIEVADVSADMYGDHRPGPRRDGGFDFAGIHLECLGVRVDKNGESAVLQNDVDGRDEGVRRNQDLITRLDAQSAQSGEESAGAVRSGQTESRAGEIGV